MKKFNIYILLFIPLIWITMSCEKNDSIFARENDKLFFDCREQSKEQIILCNGEWNANISETDQWITVSPEKGVGNGKDYDYYAINVEYNSGESRTGFINLVHEGKSYPIQIIQDKNEFSYGIPVLEGNLFLQLESTAKIVVPYTFASGKESVRVSCKITGSSAGLLISTNIYNTFVKDDGTIEIPIEGKAEALGHVQFEIFANDVSIGTVATTILEDPDVIKEGLPVGWNFHAAGISPRGSEYDYSWTTDAINPTLEVLPQNGHKVLPSSGNKNAYLTAYSNNITSLANYAFNPSIQIRGLTENDYFYCVIPVKNIKETDKIKVEASMGSAGSAAGYFALEYSDNGKLWHLAEGATVMDVFGISAPVHYYVPVINTGEERKNYNKETDQGYKTYIFSLSGINTIYEGNLFLRLRVCLDRRANGSEATSTIAPNSWADLKGLEIEIIED